MHINVSEQLQAMQLMKRSVCSFVFDGKLVCASFFETTLRFPRDVQSKTKGAYCANITRRLRADFIPNSFEGEPLLVSEIETGIEEKMPGQRDLHFPYFQMRLGFKHFVSDYHSLYTDTEPSFTYITYVWKQFGPRNEVLPTSDIW